MTLDHNTLVNASLTWSSLNDKYAIRVWAKNMFDQHWYNDVIEETVGILKIEGDPRTFGVTVSGKF